VNATGACLFSIDTTITMADDAGDERLHGPDESQSRHQFSAPIVAGIAGLMTSVKANSETAQLIAA